VHDPVVLPAPVRLREWSPALPGGDLRSIVLHWTAGDYEAVFSAYHFCLRGVSDVVVVQTHDVRANMRDLGPDPAAPYAAHTSGRNSYALGVAVCGMGGATPADFGAFPLSDVQIDALAVVAARLATVYAIPARAIFTHAEAAVEDGYFGADGDDVRWDIARLEPRPERLVPSEARATGDVLRARIAAAR
jgi:hypothetical protein